jgi:endonuclease YncB( thermonuclease family)
MRQKRPSSVPFLLRRRRRIRRTVFSLLALLALSIVLGRWDLFGRRSGDDWAIYDKQSFVVMHVVDGDTIDVASALGAKYTRVRLLGIDAPELHGDDGQPQFWAESATKYAAARSDHKTVTLKLEPTETRDRYGRLLAYVYLSDAEMLNLSLVRDGQAYADRRFRHTMRPQFEQTENAARKKGTGLWKEVKVAQMPAWRQRWMEDRLSRARAD